MPKPAPDLVLIGGPNGAGKTTISRPVLAETFHLSEFVNADTIAAGLSGFSPDRAAFAAGRIMLQRLRQLAAANVSFAFESTLASRTFAPWLTQLAHSGWNIHILYVWLRSPEVAIDRVKARVRSGGHAVPDDIVRRRHARSAANFWTLYRPIAKTWMAFDNTGKSPAPMARWARGKRLTIYNPSLYARFLESANGDPKAQEVDHPDDA